MESQGAQSMIIFILDVYEPNFPNISWKKSASFRGHKSVYSGGPRISCAKHP